MKTLVHVREQEVVSRWRQPRSRPIVKSYCSILQGLSKRGIQ
jgi:hypothetical protein